MLTQKDRQEKYRKLEELRQRRVENVRKLADVYQTWTALAAATGKSASFLTAIAGPHPRRSIAEALARDLERLLHLPAQWLDQQH